MADILTFEYDRHADVLTIGGKSYPSFRDIGGRVLDGPLMVEARGGGVFSVHIPAAEPPASTEAAVGDTPQADEDRQTVTDEAAATQRASDDQTTDATKAQSTGEQDA